MKTKPKNKVKNAKQRNISEQEILELIGTHPAYLDAKKIARVLTLGDSGTIDRVLTLGDSGTIDRVLARCDSGTIDRVLALGDSGTIARVLARCDSGTIDRVLALGDSGTIDRVLTLGDSGTIDHYTKIRAIKPNPRIYSDILSGIERTQAAFVEHDIRACALDQKHWHGTKHECGTPHCAGGWTVAVTPGGYELEKAFGMPTAAMIILRQSRPDAPLPNFDGNVPNEAALAFIKARAAEEPAALKQ